MRDPLLRKLVLTTALLSTFALFAQKITRIPVEEYMEMKLNGKVPSDNSVQPIFVEARKGGSKPGVQPKGGGGSNSACSLWREPDGCPLSQGPNDDGSSEFIPFPFTFNLYGVEYDGCWINNNGNVTFDQAYGTFSPVPFPNANYVMIAPFWGDVMTVDGQGEVLYCVSDHYVQVTWLNVGYFNAHVDKLNSFQLTLTDGTSPIIPGGNNVSFVYQNMEWTTGDASLGVNGFGGYPAVVGANLGNNVGYIQIGIFDHAGGDYNGPNVVSGVGWLAYKEFVFSTIDVTSTNIAPIATGNFICDTITVCSGELVDVDIQFLPPEIDQTITPTFSAPDFPDFSPMLTSGSSATIQGTFVAPDAGIGYHSIVFSATDDGSPNLTWTTTVTLHIVPSPNEPPVLTASDLQICDGTGAVLTVAGDYDEYTWNNGFNGSSALVGPGTYYVEGSAQGCALVSNTVVVEGIPSPTPVITGVLFNCSGDPAQLSTTQPYAQYNWSNGTTGASADVGTGTYTVTVTNAEGCTGISAPVNVLTAEAPNASFTSDPSGTVPMAGTVLYTAQSLSQNVVSAVWSVDSMVAGSGTTMEYTFLEPGAYTVSLTVTTAEGCAHTVAHVQIVLPNEIIIPNVFSPNNDGKNDRLAFEGAQYYPDTELKVFNRFGQAIFESTNYKNTWNASGVPDGTYYFVLKLFTGKEYTGHVTLLR